MSARPTSTFDGAASGPTLVLVRHGESEGNRANAFTGRRDVDLTERGVAEAKAVGAALVRDGFRFARPFSSALNLISDVARELNVTTRSVQATFEKYRATSPLAYLNAVRLGRARRRLQTIGGDETISGIALDVGFSHFGRFSQRYKRRYDESPSRTVADVREAISVAG